MKKAKLLCCIQFVGSSLLQHLKTRKTAKNKRIRTSQSRHSDKKYHIFHAEYQQTDGVLKIKTEFFEVIFEKQYISYIS